MGGGSYSGDVHERTRTSSLGENFTYRGYEGPDAEAARNPTLRKVHPTLDIKGATRECVQRTPVVIVLDVTRSRGDDAKVVYSKMPMFIGEMIERGYVPEPAFLFAAVGDATFGDQAPIQVGQFERDNRIDKMIRSFWLEEGGGGTGQESYELMAYVLARRTKLTGLPSGEKGYCFFVGDEGFYPEVSKEQVKRLVGDTLRANIPSVEIFRELQEKFHVYFIFPKATWQQRRADIDEEIKQRVIQAGGRHGGVDIRCSLLWNNRNDLDLHCITPSGEEIFYGWKRASCGGWLDVDMNVQGETTKPVENIRWESGKAKKGRYRFFVQNYAFHERNAKPTDFRVELEVNGQVQHFDGTVSPHGETHSASDITVFTVDFDPAQRPVAATAAGTEYANYDDTLIKNQWAGVIPRDHILELGDPKGMVDIVLGVLALSGGSRDLDSYLADMSAREQTDKRRAETAKSLEGVASNALARVSGGLAVARKAKAKRSGGAKRL